MSIIKTSEMLIELTNMEPGQTYYYKCHGKGTEKITLLEITRGDSFNWTLNSTGVTMLKNAGLVSVQVFFNSLLDGEIKIIPKKNLSLII